MAMLIRQLYCHILQGRQPVNVLCGTFSLRQKQCHTNAVVAVFSENQEKESNGEGVTCEKVKRSVRKKSSFDRLRINTENDFDRRERNDNIQLNEESRHFRRELPGDGFEFSDEDMTFRRENTGEFDEENKTNNVKDGRKFKDQKHFYKRKKMEDGNRKNIQKGSKPVLGSGKRFGVQYSNKKYPIKGEILFGYHPVSIALSQGRRQCHKLFIQRGRTLSPDVSVQDLANEANIPVEEVSRIHLDQLCLGRPHQGICMDVDPIDIPNLSPDDVRTAAVEPPPIWLLPYEIVDPMNMGAIIRSSYYFGVDAIVLPSNHCATASPMVSKASSGAMELMKLFHLKNKAATEQFLQDWKANVGQVIGTATGPGTVAVTDCVVTMPTLLIVGNEHRGLKKNILEQCDKVIKLPEFSPDRQSTIGSLNVSVATGIVLHALKTNSTIK
ncbi:rRNA methyltransferase 1, mitochondrial-like [Pecten maximus]|uniref:rRNA methyltransferase 1, mitochondrial-like n=1 Tax=Pecten maximus TaxID=6579 RepID=UPI00145913F9|nr:rRNA methyltransferase 1, mitochondrial-like [Pecten maximus]